MGPKGLASGPDAMRPRKQIHKNGNKKKQMVRHKSLHAALMNRPRFYRLRTRTQLAFLCGGGGRDKVLKRRSTFANDASRALLTPRFCRLLSLAKQRALWRVVARRIPDKIKDASSMRFVRCKSPAGLVRVALVAPDKCALPGRPAPVLATVEFTRVSQVLKKHFNE